MIDVVINDWLRGKILIYLNRETLERYISHWESMRRIEEATQLKTKRYVWESASGMDHWVHATVYYWLAKQKGSGETTYLPDKEAGRPVIERTEEGFRMRSLKEIMEDQKEF
jgi:hypothetical protein